MKARYSILAGAGALLSAIALSGCENISRWDCNRIAEKSVELSQSQPIKFRAITNVRETSRNESDARCEGTAQLVDGGSGTVYMRAYLDGSNIMVAYQGTPFDGAPGAAPAQTPPQGAAPAPQQPAPAEGGVPGYDTPAQQPPADQGQQ